MRSSWKTLIAVVAALVAAPQFAAADEVQEQLQQMQAQLEVLQDALKATQDELQSATARTEEQAQVIERAGLTDERSSVSALSKFLNDTDFGGVVAASYNYNFERPSTGTNVATPFNGAHNSFQYDQAHFSMSNEATEKSRAGFGVDVIHGATTGAVGDAPVLVQAYASYLMRVGDGIEMKAGRWDTPIGAEVIYVGENTNITRGLVWQLQPVSHNGLVMDMNVGDNMSLYGGVANSGFVANQADNNAKSWMLGGGWEGDTASISLNYMAFDDSGNATSDRGHLVDYVGTWDPSDNLSVWVNFDWVRNASAAAGSLVFPAALVDGDDVYGLALATRLGVTDKTGVGIRGEWVGARPEGAGNADQNVYSLTGTMDHAMTDNLTGRLELRWDHTSDATPFPGETAGTFKDDQVLVVGQLVYAF